MPFGSLAKPLGEKLRPLSRVDEVRPVTGALVRIVLLAVLAVGGAGWGLWAYYGHRFRPSPPPQASVPLVEVELR